MLKSRRQFITMVSAGLSLLVAGSAISWYLNPFRRRIAALKAAGQPVSLADLRTDPVPDDLNAYVLLQQAAAELEKFSDAVCDPMTLDSLANKRLADLTAAELLKIEQQLLSQPGLSDQVAKVASAPYAWLAIPENATSETFDLIPNISTSRNAARYLACRARFLASCGRHEEAIECCIQGLQLADQIRVHPVAITYLVRLAIRRLMVDVAYDVIRGGPIPQHSRESLGKALTNSDEVSQFEGMLRAERAFFITATEESFRKEWYLAPFSIPGACECLDLYAAQFGLIHQPYPVFAA